MTTLLLRNSLVALLCSLVSGCTTSYVVRADKLLALDGFNTETPEGRVRVVQGEEGEKVEYSRGRKLKMLTPNPNSPKVKDLGGEFTRLDVRQGLLVGALVGGGLLSIDPAQFNFAEISHVSGWKTALLVTLLTVLLAGTVFVGFVAVELSHFNFSFHL